MLSAVNAARDYSGMTHGRKSFQGLRLIKAKPFIIFIKNATSLGIRDGFAGGVRWDTEK
jgi:hypothetical protein